MQGLIIAFACVWLCVVEGVEKCPSGWINRGVSCYMISETTLTWNEAKVKCQKDGSYLAEIETIEETEFLQAQVGPINENKKGYWLGGTDAKVEGEWIWDYSGRAATVTNWNEGEPNQAGGNEDCLHLWRDSNAKWNDYPCNLKQNYICEKCPDGWAKFRTSCYKLSSNAGTWDFAQKTCKGYGAKLAEIESKEETDFLQRLAETEKGYWLGGKDDKTEGNWYWVESNKPFTFTNWNSKEPNNQRKENCASLFYENPHNWNDFACCKDLNYICEKIA